MPPPRNPKVELAVGYFCSGMTVQDAIKKSGAKCSARNIHAIVKRRGLQRSVLRTISTMGPTSEPEIVSEDATDKSCVKKLKRRLKKLSGTEIKVSVRKPFRLTSNQANIVRIKKKEKSETFKTVFKESTIKLSKEERRTTKRAQEIISEVSQSANLSPGSAPQVQRVMRYVKNGKIGVSPEKGKPKEKYPRELFTDAAAKVSICQVIYLCECQIYF